MLAAAHPLGIIHRDIKPANLYLLHDGRLKVLDFGLARVLDPDGTNAWTQTGATLGTTPYMPPEQARGRHIDGRADLFAVGATMFRLLTGRRIHDAATDFELLMKMAKEPAPRIASVVPGLLPSDVCHVIDRALAFDRDRRYADAASMLADVRAVRSRLRPLHAPRFMEEAGAVDRAAMTLPRGRSAPPPAEDPAVSVEIPVVWSVPMTASEAPLIDIDLSSSLLVPDLEGSTDADGHPLLTPRFAVHSAALEMTLLSPNGEPEPEPKKGD